MTVRHPALAAALASALAGLSGCSGGGSPAPAVTVAEAPAPASAARPPAFTRGPYLTRVSPTGARFRWRTREGLVVRLVVRGPRGGVTVARGGRLSGLRPDTAYRWIATAGGRRVSGTVRTAPRDLARPLDLIVFGDYGAPNADYRAVAALAARERARLLVTTGDNSYFVALPELLDPNIFGPLAPVLARAPNYGVVGDHDIVFPAGQRALAGAFEWPGAGERYDLRYGPVQVVGLGLRGDRGDVAFAARALARPGPRARLVVVHQPLRAGDRLIPVIARAGATAVLSGHLHAYERREVAGAPGVPFLTVGTGGAPRNDERTPRSRDARVHLRAFGLLRVRLSSAGATYRFVDVSGRVRDTLRAPLRP